MGVWLRSPSESSLFKFACGLVALLSLFADSVHAAPQVRAAAPKAWIVRNLDVPAADSGKPNRGTRTLLYDRQVQIGARDVQTYTRWVHAIGDESGLNAASQVTIEFDGDESLVLHHVRVQRAGESLDRLVLSEVRLAQREQRLEQQIYDGMQTAILFVHDLRVGDILDYAYTRRARNIAGDDKFHGQFPLGLTEPVDRMHLRVVAKTSRQLSDVWHGPQGSGAPEPQRLVHGDQTEYTWDLTATPAYELEPSAPVWYNALPWLQLSEFRTWSEVAHWGRRVVGVGPPHDPDVRRFLAELPPGSDAERILRVIRFVQDEVRYVAIETGLSRTQGAPPATVLKRRYGDCKDKSGLLIALLRGLGVKAYALLANTRYRDRLYEWAPSPDAFDHVIVMIDAAGGPYWVDSTSSLQGGGLARLQHSDLGRGLLLREGTTQLTEVPGRAHANPPRREAVDRFTLADPASEGEALLESDRLYADEEAEQMRVLMRSLGADQLSKIYLDELRQDYPQAHETTQATFRDDRDENVLRVQLRYAVPKVWSACDSGELCTARILARPIANALETVPDSERKSPLAVRYPFYLRYWSEINLPFEIREKSRPVRARGPGFDFAFEGKGDKQKLIYQYALRTNDEAIPVAKLADHRRAVELADGQLVRLIERRRPVPDGIHWPMVALVVLVALLSASVAYRYMRSQRNAADVTNAHGEARNMGGWVAVLAFGLIAHPVSTVTATAPVASLVFSRASWDQLTHIEGDLQTALVTLSTLILMTVVAVLSCALVPPFLLRRREFRKCFIVFTLVNLLLSTLAVVVYTSTSESGLPAGTSWFELLFSVVSSGAWIAYVWLSKRSAATFVR